MTPLGRIGLTGHQLKPLVALLAASLPARRAFAHRSDGGTACYQPRLWQAWARGYALKNKGRGP
jgi:hypothetical protein